MTRLIRELITECRRGRGGDEDRCHRGCKTQESHTARWTALERETGDGKVVWQDGSPAKNAHVSLYNGGKYIRLIKVDEKGRFNFHAYGDFAYEIDAEVWGPRGKSERVSINKEKSTDMKLVLKRAD